MELSREKERVGNLLCSSSTEAPILIYLYILFEGYGDALVELTRRDT